MWTRRSSQPRAPPAARFNLLFLEDGEYFLDDYSAFRYLEPRTNTHRKMQGRLKVCTRGLFFVPNDLFLPILRFPFRGMRALPTIAAFADDDGEQYVMVHAKSVVEMRKRGIDHPYIVKELADEEQAQFMFSLTYSSTDTFVSSLETIYKVANLPRRSMNKADEERLLVSVLAPRRVVEFDPSWLVDYREQLLFSQRRMVTRIEPLLNFPGCIVLTDQRLYFQPARLNNVASPILHWNYTAIEQLYRRRYLLRQTGLEFTTRTGESFFFSFRTRKDRDDIYELLVEQPTLSRFERSNVPEMMRKWQKREISNFEYLMFLNNAAGRTKNDLTQYPVFPWILQDYKSTAIDLSDPKSYRDLSKPVGALNDDRLAYFRSRYEMMPRGEEAEGMPPPFLYGTHYSTPGYVLYYLVRMVPQHMLCLQGGKFDTPDRLFRSIDVSWQGCTTNHSDVKELIPEFFDTSLSPAHWLTNHQHLNLGTTQSLQRVGDVELPPWAANSPIEFVRVNRDALESEYVSQHLHEWIDLIFGYKQQGEEALKANNLFYYLSYEGAIDLETVTDPIEKCSIESQIQEFGQTPKLLFTTPHPARQHEGDTTIELATTDLIPSPRARQPRVRVSTYPPVEQTRRGRNAIELNGLRSRPAKDKMRGSSRSNNLIRQVFQCVHEPLIQVQRTVGDLAVHLWHGSLAGKPPKHWHWKSKLKHQGSSSQWQWKADSPQMLHSGEITCTVLSRDNMTLYSTCKHSCCKMSALADGSATMDLTARSALSCCDVSPDEKRLLVGCWDNRVYMYSMETGKELDRVFSHSDGVSALCVVDREHFLTSSWDSTIKYWRYTDTYIVASPIKTFLECDEAILCLDVSSDGAWAAAGAKNGVVYLLDLRNVSFYQEVLVSPDLCGDVASVSFAANNSTFVCMTMANELVQYNLEGERLYGIEVNATGQVRCFESDGEYAVGGTTNGKLFFWRLHEEAGKEVVYEIPRAHDTIISSLVVACNGASVITGSVDGIVKVWKLGPKPPPPKRKRRSMLQHEIMMQRRLESRALQTPASYTSPFIEETQWFLAC